jgi:cytochrome c-type biogenesis protein CcmF
MMLSGNLILLVSSASVLLGTLYPLIIDALNLGKLSVGPPYFNTVFVPVMAPALLLMGLAPFALWKKADARAVMKELRWVAAFALAASLAVPFAMGGWTPLTGLGILLAAWIAGSVALQVTRRLRAGRPPVAWWAMQLAHFGIAVFIVGVTLVGGFQEEKDVRMDPGDTVSVGGHRFKFMGVREVPGPNYIAMRGEFEVSRNNATIRMLYPEKRNYFSSEMPMTDAAIDPGLTRDVYVSLGDALDGKAWAVRVYYKPFVDWIWAGCFLMALGGICALSDRRYRQAKRAAQPAEAMAGGAA